MQKFVCVTILAAFSFAATACRTNAPPASSTSPAPAAQETPSEAADSAPVSNASPSDHRPLLVCFGDSLTAGYGTNPGESYPDDLQGLLDGRRLAYRVVNEGVSGNTTKDGVERLPEILSLHATVIVVEFGGNDGLRGLRIEDTRANLDHILSTLKASGAKIALAGISLPPDYGPDYIQQFNDTYKLLAKKYRLPLLPFLLKNVYGVPGLMQHDNTHATARGNQIVARNVLPLVLPLLQK